MHRLANLTDYYYQISKSQPLKLILSLSPTEKPKTPPIKTETSADKEQEPMDNRNVEDYLPMVTSLRSRSLTRTQMV